MKLFGITLGKQKTQPQIVSNEKKRAKASKVIIKQYKREVRFQIDDIRIGLIMAENIIMPDRRRLHEIYRYILRDTRMISQVRDAIIAVQSEPFMIYNEDESINVELSKKYRKRWLNDCIKYSVQREIHGYSVLEMDNINPAEGTIGVVKLIPREHISIENQWILIEGQIGGDYMEYGDIMWDIDMIEFVREREDYGLLLECSYQIIYKYYASSDWSRGSEKFGMPILSMTVDTIDDNELDNAESKAANFGTDGYIVGQKGDTIDIIERRGQKMHDIWVDRIKLSNEEVTIRTNGQTSTTDQKAFVGSAEVQERKFEDLTLARLQEVADDINEKLFPYLIHKGFTDLKGKKFYYPVLIRERERKIKGSTTATDPTPAAEDMPTEPEAPKEEADNKNDGGQQ